MLITCIHAACFLYIKRSLQCYIVSDATKCGYRIGSNFPVLSQEEKLFIGGVLCRHICQLVCNAHAITEIQVEGGSPSPLVENECQVRVATAIYPTASLMNHSCDPTIISR